MVEVGENGPNIVVLRKPAVKLYPALAGLALDVYDSSKFAFGEDGGPRGA